MAEPLEHVRPGDLISALVWNSLVDKLNNVNTRLSALENQDGSVGTDVVVNELIPDGVLTIGDDLEIRGRNFAYVLGAQRVYFNSTRAINYKNGSSDTRLLLEIPDVPGVTEAGSAVTLTVTNPTSSATRQVTLKREPTAQQGNVSLDFLGVKPQQIQPNAQATFTYRVASQALLPTTLTIAPTISLTNIQSSLQILNANESTTDGGKIPLQPGEVKLFLIRIPTVPNLATGTPFTLQVIVGGNGIDGDKDGPREFKVNVAADPPDASTFIDIVESVPASALVNNKSKLRVTRGATAIIKLQIRFNEAGDYTFVAPTHADWNIQPSDENPASPFHITTAPNIVPLDYTISPKAQASGSVHVTFTVQRQVAGSTVKRIADLDLEVSG